MKREKPLHFARVSNTSFNTPKGNNPPKAKEDTLDKEEYDEMELLERLESLREDMEDLGVTTLAEVIERIETMHRHLDKRG